jgi:hypothetical protein
MGPSEDEEENEDEEDDEDVFAGSAPDGDVLAEEHAASREAVTAAISISTCRLRSCRSECHFTELLRSLLDVLHILRISCSFPNDATVGI